MKKIILFVRNGRPERSDMILKGDLESKGNKVIFSNGSMEYGFKDSCNAIVNTTGNKSISRWAEESGIEVIKNDSKADEPMPKEPEEKPVVKRGRKPASEKTEEKQ